MPDDNWGRWGADDERGILNSPTPSAGAGQGVGVSVRAGALPVAGG